MKRSSDRILTTHPGKLPDPANRDDVMQARGAGNQARFDELVKQGAQWAFAKQREASASTSSATASSGRAATSASTTAASPASRKCRCSPARRHPSRSSCASATRPSSRSSSTSTTASATRRARASSTRPRARAAPSSGRSRRSAAGAMKHEIAIVKAGIAAAGGQERGLLLPGARSRLARPLRVQRLLQDEEEYVYALAEVAKHDFKAVADAGFMLQIDDPGLVDTWAMLSPCRAVEEYRKRVDLRIEATNWALEGIPEERVRFHTCWGSWHTPHVTDLPFEHTSTSCCRSTPAAYSIEAADVQHELDYKVWETTKLPDGKVFIPGVIAHKTSTVEPPELVADRIVRYANIMGRENIIAGVDCGVGNRCYPDIAWASSRRYRGCGAGEQEAVLTRNRGNTERGTRGNNWGGKRLGA